MPSESVTFRPFWACRILTPIYLIAIGIAVLVPDGRFIALIKYNVGAWMQGSPKQPHFLIEPVVLGDITLNILAFIPLALLLSLGWPRLRPRIWVLICIFVSIAAEIGQFVLPVGRRPDLFNILENGLGALIGGGIADWTHRRGIGARITPRRAAPQDGGLPSHQ